MTTTIAPGMASTAMSFDGSTGWQLSSQYTAAGNWSVSFWIQTSLTSAGATIVSGHNSALPTAITFTLTGNVVVTNLGASTTFIVSPINDNIPHHVVVTGHSTNNISVYVDGVVSATTPMTFFALNLEMIGMSGAGGIVSLTGTLQDIAVFDKALSQAEVSALYNRSRGYLAEDSATRVTRLLDDVAWPATWRDITATPEAAVGELVYNSATVNAKLQEIQDTEQGRIFAGKDNHLVFLSRYYQQEVTAGKTSQQIFSDDGGATALPYSTFGFDWHEIDVTNDMTVTTPTTWASESDATSITNNDRQSKKVDTILTTFADADAMARGLVAQYKNPTWRATPIMVYPANLTSRWANVLGLELGHRATVEITPMALGSQNARDVTIEQVEWSITPGLWSFVMTGSPVRDAWFIWDDAGSLVDGPKVIGY